jgi:hypothetical protein
MARAATALTAAAVLVLGAGAWIVWTRSGPTVAVDDVARDTIEDLLMDLHAIPLDPSPARPFRLAALDGTVVSAADLGGQAALLYFWATW